MQSSVNKFDNNYIEWKGWESEFGVLSRNKKAYLNAEFKRLNIERESGLTVLEVGFGNGSFLAYAKEKGWSVSGVEENPILVKRAKANGYDVALAQDMSQYNPKSYDLIVAFDVFEHIQEDKAINFITNLVALLKIGGVLMMRFPNGDSPFGLVNQNGDVTHVNAIGSRKIEYYSSVLKLEIMYCQGEAIPINIYEPVRSLKRLVTLALRKLINSFVNIFFLPGMKVDYASSCLVVALKK